MSHPTTPAHALRTVEITTDEHGVHVFPLWDGVDRERVSGSLFANTPSGRKLAQRLQRAILAGAVLYDIEVRTDANGQTYVNTRSRVMAKYANADLKRLGF